MKGDKIISFIPKLQQLSEESLDLISSAIDSCLIVQAMEQSSMNSLALQKLVNAINN